ncbi:MAG TPA: SRPBCC domain-containing protein [Thermoleophilaceae bacterium]
MNGTLETIDGRPALRFERRLPHSVERVWRAITEPEELKAWFPDTIVELGKAARDGAGWHVCLDQLEHQLDGTSPPWSPSDRPSLLRRGAWAGGRDDRAAYVTRR